MGYLLRVFVPKMAAFDAFYRGLTDTIPVKNFTSHFAMERIMFTMAYPVETNTR